MNTPQTMPPPLLLFQQAEIPFDTNLVNYSVLKFIKCLVFLGVGR